MTHILEVSTQEMEGQPPKQEVSWDVGVISLHIYTHIDYLLLAGSARLSLACI